MKKVLGWAVVATLVTMGMYFGLMALGVSPFRATIVAVTVAAILTVSAFDSIYAYAAIFAVAAVLLVGVVSGIGTLATALATALVGLAAYKVAREVGIEFVWVYAAYLIEGVGLYGTLKLGLWQPAAVAALLLGLWWLVIRLAEKVRPAVSI
jgi:hypothetical protein